MLALLVLATALAPARAAAAPEAPVATLRVLVQNIYGRREKDCEERYRALAARVLAASPPYDVVALNEHWKVPLDRWFTCDADVLTRALESDGRYAGAGKSIQHAPAASGLLQVSGGDSIFTLRRIAATSSARFSNSKEIPLSGWVRTQIELTPGVDVDVWDAHFESLDDGCSDACRKAQGAELGAALRRLSGPGGRPVLLVGDFNTGGPLSAAEKPPYRGNGGYDEILAGLGRPRDAWLELGTGDAGGYTYDCATDHAQACAERERIDYVLLPQAPDVVAPSSAYALEPRSIEVVRWKTPAGGDVSDHYGLDATLEVRRRPAGRPAAASARANALAAFAARLSAALRPAFDGPGR